MPKTKADIASRYTVFKGGLKWRELNKHAPSQTVSDLIELLKKLPPDLPVNLFDDGVKAVWANVGQDNEHLMLEENDGTWDEDDEG